MPAAAVISAVSSYSAAARVGIERLELAAWRPCVAKRVPGSIVSWYSDRCDVPSASARSSVAAQPSSVSPGSA